VLFYGGMNKGEADLVASAKVAQRILCCGLGNYNDKLKSALAWFLVN